MDVTKFLDHHISALPSEAEQEQYLAELQRVTTLIKAQTEALSVIAARNYTATRIECLDAVELQILEADSREIGAA